MGMGRGAEGQKLRQLSGSVFPDPEKPKELFSVLSTLAVHFFSSVRNNPCNRLNLWIR